MADLPSFRHIHCSSRFDRSAATLETDLDDWMAQCSVITLTEVGNDNRAATMREKGWAYYNSPLGGGRDDGGIAWRSDTWKRVAGDVRRLSNRPIPGRGNNMYAATVVLKHIDGHRLLVSVSHFPAGHGDSWEQRKVIYTHGLGLWATYIAHQERRHRTDGSLICGDWNLNLKLGWVQDLLDSRFDAYRQAWRRFPTEGGSRFGGPVAPLGAPGKAKGDTIIDGSLYRGLKVSLEPNLMARVSSSDHRPYREGFTFLSKAEALAREKASGDTYHGDAWWGFGDYLDDELYFKPGDEVAGEAGGEVL